MLRSIGSRRHRVLRNVKLVVQAWNFGGERSFFFILLHSYRRPGLLLDMALHKTPLSCPFWNGQKVLHLGFATNQGFLLLMTKKCCPEIILRVTDIPQMMMMKANFDFFFDCTS